MSVAFTGNFQAWSDLIARVQALPDDLERIDYRPLIPEVERIMRDENARARVTGTDAQDRYLRDVKDPYDRRRGGHGPRLAPRESSSGVVTDYRVTAHVDPDGVTFIGSWPDLPWLKYHVPGPDFSARLGEPSDILGFGDEARKFILDVHQEFVRLRVEEKIRDMIAGFGSGLGGAA